MESIHTVCVIIIIQKGNIIEQYGNASLEIPKPFETSPKQSVLKYLT